MNFFVPQDLIHDVEQVLKCDKDVALKELLRQSRRIFSLYTQKPIKHAKHWNKVDTAALFALGTNKQLPKTAMEIALTDLEKAEESLTQLSLDNSLVYNQFIYVLESLTKPARKIEDVKDRLLKFVFCYTDDQIATLRKYLDPEYTKESQDELCRGIRDGIQRVRSNASIKLKGAFVNRLKLADTILEELVKGRGVVDVLDPKQDQ